MWFKSAVTFTQESQRWRSLKCLRSPFRGWGKVAARGGQFAALSFGQGCLAQRASPRGARSTGLPQSRGQEGCRWVPLWGSARSPSSSRSGLGLCGSGVRSHSRHSMLAVYSRKGYASVHGRTLQKAWEVKQEGKGRPESQTRHSDPECPRGQLPRPAGTRPHFRQAWGSGTPGGSLREKEVWRYRCLVRLCAPL